MVYRLKTVTGGFPACGMMAVRISTHFDTQPEIAGVLRRVKLPLAPGWQFMSMIVLLSLETGEVLGMLPDSHIQKMRVGGTTALGVKLLARPDSEMRRRARQRRASRSGARMHRSRDQIEARAHLQPDAGEPRTICAHMSERIGVEVHRRRFGGARVRDADIVLAATSPYEPVYDARG